MSGVAADPSFCWIHPSGTSGLTLTAIVLTDTGASAGSFSLSGAAGASGAYTGTFPNITPGHYCVLIRNTSGGAYQGQKEVDWMGTANGYLVSNAHIYELLVAGLISDAYNVISGSTTTNVFFQPSTSIAPGGVTYGADNRKDFTAFTIWDASSGEYHTRNIDTWDYQLSTLADVTFANDPRGALPFTPTNGDRLYLHAANAIPSALDDGSVTADAVATGAIDADAIAANAITSAKIAASAIGATQIASNAITNAKIAANAIGASELATDAVAEIADGVWDEPVSGHTTAGTFGEEVQAHATSAEITAQTSTLEGRFDTVDSSLSTLSADLAIVDGNVDLILEDTGTTIPGLIGALSIPTALEIADAVWDEPLADHLTAGSTGAELDSLSTLIGNIASTGSAVNAAADSFVLTTGSVPVGSVTDTAAADGVEHEINDDSGQLDCYYEFDIGGDGLPTSVSFVGRLNGPNDDLVILAYNWVGAAWEPLTILEGSASSTNETINIPLLTRHVGTGSDIGTVRIRFWDNIFSLTSAELFVDQILVSYSIANRSVGYALGAIWIDTVNGTAGTEPFVNGTADNKVLTLADAITLAGTLNINRFFIVNGSSITLSQAFTNFTFLGNGWTLNLNGQAINGCYFEGADDITGTSTTTTPNVWEACDFATCTVGPGTFRRSGFALGPFTMAGDGEYRFNDCRSDVPGTNSPEFDYNSHDADVNFRNWSGGMNLSNITDTGAITSCDLDPGTVTVNASCTSTTANSVNVRGVGVVNDNSPNNIVNSDSLVKADQLDQLFFGRKVAINTVEGSAGVAFPQGTPGNPVDNITDARTVADNVGDTGVQAYEIIGSITLNVAHEDWLFSGIGGSNSALNLGGQNVAGSQFLSMNVQGTMVAETDIVEVRNGPIGNIAGFRGSVIECGLFGTWAFGTAARTNRFVRCQEGNSTPVFDCTNLNSECRFMLYDGAIEFENLAAGDTIILDSSGGASVTFAANCTGGSVIFRGVVEYTDNSGNVTVDDDAVLPFTVAVDAATIADAVWDEPVSGHTTAGTFGELLDTNIDAAISSRSSHAAPDLSNLDVAVSTRASQTSVDTVDANVDAILVDTDATIPGLIAGLNDPTAAAIADAVWDEPIADHAAAGSTGEALSDAAAGGGGSGPTASEIADAVWDEPIADHTTAGSFGAEVQTHATSAEISALNNPSLADIADAVWDESIATHGTPGSAGDVISRLDVTVSSRSTFDPGSQDVFLDGGDQAAIVDQVWDEPLAGHVTAGTTGEAQNRLDAAISSRSTFDPTMDDVLLAASEVASIADAVWDEGAAAHVTGGTFGGIVGAALDATISSRSTFDPASDTVDVGEVAGVSVAGVDDFKADVSSLATAASISSLNDLSQADVQAALTAQGYTVARAGNLDNLDAAVSTRATPGDITTPPTAAAIADAVWDEPIADHAGVGSTGEALAGASAPSAADVADAVWDEPRSGHSTAGTFGQSLALVDVAVSTRATPADITTRLDSQGLTSARAALLDNLDAAVSSRSVFDGSTGVFLTTAGVEAVADQVWGETLADHSGIAGSTAEALDGASAPSAADVADAVWDEPRSGHSTAGTFGEFIDAAISSRVDSAGVQAAMTLQGYNPSRALLLDNLDAAVSSVLTAIAALNDIDQSGVQAALTAQGYTSVRAALLDNLDAAVSSIATDIAALENLSSADVQAALTAQGYTVARAAELDSIASVLTGVERVRKISGNRVVISVDDQSVTVYEDDGTTVAFTFTVSADGRERTPD